MNGTSKHQIAFEATITALLVVDPYNDFISEGGKLWKFARETAEAVHCVPNMIKVLEACRAAGLRVFIAPHRRWREGDYTTWKYVAPIQASGGRRQVFAHGTWGGEFHPAFKPKPGDIVAQEHWCSSGFASTDLDQQLRRHGIDKLIIIGLRANTCIDSTMRFAAELGYEVTLVRDSIASFNWDEMKATIDLNAPAYANAILSTEELISKIFSNPVQQDVHLDSATLAEPFNSTSTSQFNTIKSMPKIHAYAADAPKGQLKPFEFDPGQLGPEEVEIKVSHCGLCHSDLSMLDNEWGMSQYPFVPGHEVTGTVVALGEGAKGLKIGQRVGLGWTAHSCLACHECLSGNQHLCATGQGTIVGRHGGFADRVRAQWTWVRPLPEALDMAKVGPLLCGGITVFAPFLIHNTPSTARVGIIGIGGLGHMALQFANKWGCEVHAFTTSNSKEAEARQLGAHYVHNTKQDGVLKKLARSLDLIISTINAPQDMAALLDTVAPNGCFHNVGAVLKPLEVPAFSLIFGQKSVAGSPTGSPTAIDHMLEFSARHSVAPIVEYFPMSKVNDALERLRSGKARYRIVLVNEVEKSRSAAASRSEEQRHAVLTE